jgi:hypothetical protein
VTLKDELRKENIEFSEYEVNDNKDAYDQILAATKLDILPTVYLQNIETGSGPILVAGRDFFSKEEAIEKIKKYI